MDVAAWLQDLGLERYVPAFRDNEVDGDVLPDLTAEDLIGLGVTLIGHRRKLLSAIAALGAAAPAPALTVPPPAPAPAQAERRRGPSSGPAIPSGRAFRTKRRLALRITT
jgi:hypothetical protein